MQMADPQPDQPALGADGERPRPKLDLVLDEAPPAAAGSNLPAGEQHVDHIALPIGYRLAEYTIESVLGSGGFGLTYLARDNHLECEVAIKEYLPHDMAIRVEGQTVCARSQDWGQDYQAGLKRFLAEARTLASFRHPNIVRITRFFEANGTAYMVMEYERGQSLREWRRRHPVLSEEDFLHMFLPLLEGLELVHNGKVTHRDIKPANIYVREADGSLVLLDFGSARQTAAATHGLTTIVTPGYAPFEQYHSRGVQGPWSDIYAIGGVMYWLVSGERPLEAPARLKEDTLAPASEIARGRFSPSVLAAIDWALQSDENKRPRSVAAFRAALLGQVAVPPAGPDAAPKTAPAPAAGTAPAVEAKPAAAGKSRSALWIGLVVVGLAVAGFGVRHFLTAPAAEPPAVAPLAEAAPKADQAAPAAEVPAAVVPPPVVDKPGGQPLQAKAVEAKPVEAKPAAARPAPATGKPVVEIKRAAAGESRPSVQDAKLTFNVMPYGDVYLNGKKVGRTPPLAELPVPPGTHKVEVRGDAIPFTANFSFDLKAGETRQVWTRFGSD